MKKRTKFEDTASMALIYINRATGRNMISYDKAVLFDDIINNNLDNMNSEINPFLFYDEEVKLYFHTIDEEGNRFLVINPTSDFNDKVSHHMGCLPIDLVIASQMENSLNVIGLQLVDGKLQPKIIESKKRVRGL